MKLKSLMALAIALLCSAGAWAQTDVTSTYITNADFESGNTFAQKKANAVSTSIPGWTVSEGGNYQYYTVGASGSNTPDNDSGFGKTVTAASGSKYVHIRHGWKGSSTEISQTLSSLPKGKFTLSLKHKGATPRSKSPTLKLSATPDGSSAIEASYSSYPTSLTRDNSTWTWDNNYGDWSVLSCDFELTEAKNTTIKIRFTDSNIQNTSNDEVIYDDVKLTYKNVNGTQLYFLIAQATAIDAKLGTLTSEIATAQGVYDGINDTPAYQETIDNAISTLQTAINTKVDAYSFDPAGDDISPLYIWNNGFDIDINFSSSSSTATVANTVYPTFGWNPTVPGNCTGATMGYGYSGSINGNNATAPTQNADGTTDGGALIICVGWSGQVTYRNQAKTFPAGSYRITYRAYNGNTINTTAVEAIPLVGFVPTEGDAIINSTTETFTNQDWSTHTYDFELVSPTEGKIQIGLKPIENTNSYNAPELFIDEVKLTYFNPLTLAQIQWQEAWDALDALDETLLPNAAETAINDALSAAEPTTVEDYNTAKAALQALTDSYDGIKAAYDKVLALKAFVTEEVTNSTGTKTTIEAALATATTNIETRTAADDLTSDYNTLETARQTYVTGGAQPTAGHVFDYTFKIPDAAVTSASDWSSKRLNSGQQYTGAPDNTYFDTYNENRNIQKNIGTLRLGKYELKAATRSEASVTVGNIYVSQNSANLNQTNIHHDGNTGGDLGNGWSWTTVPFDNYKDDQDITLGFYSECGSSKWAGADDFHLYYKGNTVDNETAEALKETVVSGKMNATVASTQATALSNFESEQTFENYNTLKSAIDAANNSKTVYAGIDAAITNVEGWTTNATSVTDPMRLKYNNGSYSDETTANDIYAEYQAAEITALVAASATDWTSAIINASFETGDKTGWTATSRNDTDVKSTSNPTYYITSGDITSGSYMFNSWGGTAENDVKQTIKNLPAGTYTLVAVLAGFQGESLVIAANEETGTTVVAGDKTVGYLTSVTFTLDATADVIIKASNTKSQGGSDASFIKADNFQLYVGSSVPASASKPNLLYAINNATNARKSANEGVGIFQIPADAGPKLADAISTAQAVYDNASATLEQINQAVTDVDEARTTYEATELNAPVDGKRYCIKVATAEHAKLGNAVVVTLGSTSTSNPTGYTFNASDTPKAYLAQAFTFTQVSGNSYKISIEMPEGTVYLTNGNKNGSTVSWKASQIQGTTDSEKAMEFTIEAADVANAFYIYNTETNSTIACQAAGYLYTEAGNAYFAVEEASQASVSGTLAAGKYATRIFPFTPELPSGIKAYSCEATEVDGTTLTLFEDETPDANVPYILYNDTEGSIDISLSGYGTANNDKFTVGYLTGQFAPKDITSGYVLQTLNNKQAFYVVDSEDPITVPAYRAYLTAPAAEVKAFYFNFNDATAISETLAPTGRAGEGPIFNLAGQKMSKLQKGVNIVNGKKVLVK